MDRYDQILEILDFLKANMARKDDLKDFVKKADLDAALKNMATKADLRFAMDVMVTQSDLASTMEAFEQRMDEKMDRRFEAAEHRITRQFDEKLAALRSDIMSYVDGFIYLYKKIDTEVTALHGRVTRLESPG